MTAIILKFPPMGQGRRALPVPNAPNRIRERRMAFNDGRGMSQAELGDKIGVNGNMIGRMETGEREVKISQLRQIAAVLGCSVGDLLSPDDLGLSPEEAIVLDTMRQGEPQARTINGVAETVRSYEGPPAPEAEEEPKRA